MSNYRYFTLPDVTITHVRGSGAGGQHRNKRWTGIRVVHEPTGIEALATERRSQQQNLEAALERLDAKLCKHFSRPKKRVATRATKASQRRRLESKKKTSLRKQARQRFSDG